MTNPDKDYVIHGPPFEYIAQYTSIGKYIFDRLQEDPAFLGQIEADTGDKYTYGEILDRSIRLALWFRDMDIGPGDVVCYMTLNHKDVIIVVYATWFAGAILSPWDAKLTTQEIVHFMDQTKPKIVICSKDAAISAKTAAKELNVAPLFVIHGESSGFIPFEDTQIHSKTKVDHFQCTEVEENDLALLVCTSGTSALPKIMKRTQKSILITAQQIAKRIYRGSVLMTFKPLCWVSGLNDALIGPSLKIQRVITPYFDEELAWKWIEQYRVKFISLNPPNLLRMIYCDVISKYDISSLEAIVAGGAILRTWHCKKFEEIAPVGCRLFQAYGTTETGGAGTAVLVRADNLGSCGTLTSGMSAKIIDPDSGRTISPYEPGELCLKHPAMFTGYYNDPALTKAVIDSEGWFHTGDLARFNRNGELFWIDRLKDIIDVNGLRVSPTELEAILGKHPGVQHVGVVGKRAASGQRPVAFVVKTPGSNVTETELSNFLKAQASAEVSQSWGGVRFIHDMPRSTSEKIKRWELRKMLESETL